MKRSILLPIISVIFFSCNNQAEKSLSYAVIENSVYSIPAKSQVSYRVCLNDSALTDSQLISLTDSIFYDAKYTKTKYHSKPTHVFVYVYGKQGDYENDNGSWIAKREKENNNETETILKKAAN